MASTVNQRRQWHPTPVPLPGKSHGRRSLVGGSPWGRTESDTTEWLHFHFSFSCIGGGNGNPLQCSCLENPRDGGAWWAAVYGVTQSRTRLKRLSSSTVNKDTDSISTLWVRCNLVIHRIWKSLYMKSSTTVQIFHSDSSLHKKQSSIQSTVPCYRIQQKNMSWIKTAEMVEIRIWEVSLT